LNLLLDDHPLLIPPTLAKELGNLNEAAFLQQLHYWLDIKKQTGKNFVDGRYWVYNSVDEWLKQFPWMTSATLRRTIMKLVEKGYVIKDNHSPKQMDHTCWYTINYDKIAALSRKLDKERMEAAEAALATQKEENAESLVPQASDRSAQNEQIELSKSANRIAQNEQIELSKLANRSAQNEQIELLKSANRIAQNAQIDLLKMSKSNCSKCANRSAQNEQINYYTKTNNTETNYTETNQETTTTTTVTRASPRPDVEDVLSSYNELCPSFPQALALTPKREQAICALFVAGYDIARIRQVFRRAEKSDFLSGRSNDAEWDRFDFDWLLQLPHFVSVLEGKYDNCSVRQQKRMAASDALQAQMREKIAAECADNGNLTGIESQFYRSAMERHCQMPAEEIKEAGP